MSNIPFGNKMEKIDISPSVHFSKVVVTVNENNQFIAGDDTGATLEVTIPFGSQAVADEIYERLSSFTYNPFNAENVIIDPAAELGDEVSVQGITSGLYRQKLTFDHFMWQTVEAPYQSETESEYKFERVRDREYRRQFFELGSRISQTSQAITTEVDARIKEDKEIRSTIKQTAYDIVFQFAQENGLEDVTKYIRFEDGKIYLGIEGNPFQVIISNNRISFMDNTNETAYAANNQFRMPYGVVDNTLDLGGYQLDATDGIKFKWKGREQEDE